MSGTRDELLSAGLRLFAERGFRAVSVGEIEQAVGLVPRRGALYRHFASKEALLEAAVRGHLESVAATRDRLGALTGTDVHADALVLARWVLVEMDRQHDITRVLEREGERLPALREEFRREISEASYAAVAEVLRTWLGPDHPVPDLHALAVLLLGGLVNARRSAWTLGAPPAGLDDERTARAWADLCVRVVRGG